MFISFCIIKIKQPPVSQQETVLNQYDMKKLRVQ